MPGIENVRKDLQDYQQSLIDKIDEMSIEFENKYYDYQKNSSIMSNIIKQAKEEELSELQERIDAFQQQSQQDLQNKQAELLQPIINKAKSELEELSREFGFNLIINNIEDVVLYKSPTIDDLTSSLISKISDNSSVNHILGASIVNKIGVVNFNNLLQEIPGIDNIRNELQDYQQSLTDQLDQMRVEFENKYLEYQSKSAGMSPIIKQNKEQELAQLQERIDAFQQQSQQDLQNKQAELLQPIINKAKSELEELSREFGFNLIINNIEDVVLYKSPTIDDLTSSLISKISDNSSVNHILGASIVNKIGVVNFNNLLQEIPGIDNIRNELQDYQQSLTDQLDQMRVEFENKYLEYQSKSAGMSPIIKQNKEQELAQLQERIDAFQTQSQNDLQNKQTELLKPLIDKAKAEISNFSQKNNVDIVLNGIEDIILFRDSNILDVEIDITSDQIQIPQSSQSKISQLNEVKYPPIISISDISFSQSILNAGESAQLIITLKNTGLGDAKEVTINLNGGVFGLVYRRSTKVPVITKNGGTQTVEIPFKAGIDVPTSDAIISIEINEPTFKVKIPGKQLSFRVTELRKPELILAQFAVIENLSAYPNNQIDINEQIEVKCAIQNVGQGLAEDVIINISNDQLGVMVLGYSGNSNILVRKDPVIRSIESGKFEIIKCCFFVNSEFTEKNLTFTISVQEKYGKFGYKITKSVDINKYLEEEGFIRTIASNTQPKQNSKVLIEDIPEFQIDVDINIPENVKTQNDMFALIIGNENYSSEINVQFARNDAQVFSKYATKTLGIPEKNIRFIQDATYGQMVSKIDWIINVIEAYNGKAKVLLYYAGHGMPDSETKNAYLLPADGISTNKNTAISTQELYKRLTESPSKSVTVIIDACFSGAIRGDGMLAESRSVVIKPKEETFNGNIVVFSATTGEETAHPYMEKQHGLFTYYFLKKLQESKGGINYKELFEYVKLNVNKQSIVTNNKPQHPQIKFSLESQDSWGGWKFKE